TQEATAKAALELVQNDDVQVILGPNISDTALVAAKIAESTQTPLISITSTHSDLTTNNSFVFQFAVNNRVQARMLSDYLINKLGYKSAAVIYKATSDYSRGYKKEFVEKFTKLGGTITNEVNYLDSPLLQNNEIESIKQNQPDVILMPNFTDDTTLIVRQLKNQNIQSVFVGSDSWEVDQLKTLPDFQGSLVIDHWYSGSYKNIGMPTDFTENVSPLAYDATHLLWNIICNTPSPNRISIKDGLNKTTSFKGITGTVEEFIDGNVVRNMAIVEITNNQSQLNGVLPVRKFLKTND
ncbi:MAG: ABC transporter substrate-binding protein, partial [Kangiellaceae bacterium]|nr:ABC transporter substrate-binding protein [Kangiellaceae bacterium]